MILGVTFQRTHAVVYFALFKPTDPDFRLVHARTARSRRHTRRAAVETAPRHAPL